MATYEITFFPKASINYSSKNMMNKYLKFHLKVFEFYLCLYLYFYIAKNSTNIFLHSTFIAVLLLMFSFEYFTWHKQSFINPKQFYE